MSTDSTHEGGVYNDMIDGAHRWFVTYDGREFGPYMHRRTAESKLAKMRKIDREADARADVLASMTDVERRLALAWIAGYAPGTFAEGVEAAKRVTQANFEATEPCGCRSARFRPHGPGHQAGCKAGEPRRHRVLTRQADGRVVGTWKDDLPSGVDVSDLPTSGETVVEDERGPVPGLTVFEDWTDDGTPEPTFEAGDRVSHLGVVGTVIDRNIIGRGPEAPERVLVGWDARGPEAEPFWYDAALLHKL